MSDLQPPVAPVHTPATPVRWFIGIGVGEYDDPALNLGKALIDVDRMTVWFTRESQVDHGIPLSELATNPTWAQISGQLRNFLNQCAPQDVVVVYIACHGEQEAGEAYLFGRDTPRINLAGCALPARQLGLMLGSSKAHNVVVIVDACVAGAIAAVIADAARTAVREQNTRDPFRQFATVIIASTFGLNPAQDGQFVEAFVRTVANERWTGTVRPWISVEQLIQGLNEELRETASGQQVECSYWFNGEIQLIPNPNVGRRERRGLFNDEEFAAHFDPASRGVSRSETGSFFTGRTMELARASQWLRPPEATGVEASPMFVITGSPGTGKSALLSRVAVLSQPHLLPADDDLPALPPETLPRPNALDGVIWCHGKTRRQVIGELARVLNGTASTPEALFGLAKAHGRVSVIAVDALDEAAAGEAKAIAHDVLAPLVIRSSVRLMIATRQHAVGGARVDLLDELAVPRRELLELDLSTNCKTDMIRYVETRLRARGFVSSASDCDASAMVSALAQEIVAAAGKSFLVASIAARSAQPGPHQAGTYKLPAKVGEALASYLDRLPDPERIRDVLRPLAWALGPGLPWGTIWPALATALADDVKAVDDDAIAASLAAAGDLIVEFDDDGEPVYRLFHEALAEHLRATTSRHTEAPALICRALLALRAERKWSDVPRYLRTFLPAFLTNAEMFDELSDVLLDPVWARQRRIDTGDPLAPTHDVEAAASLFLKHRRLLHLAPLCHQHSRAMTETLPSLIEVLALSGQHRRAEALAANLTDVADRMLAYRALAQVYASNHDPDGARGCAGEMERALPAMHVDHRPMACCWTAQAFMAAGLTERAHQYAMQAIDAVGSSDDWDRQNGLFWAAMAARLTGHEEARARVRIALKQVGETTFRNQFLQAAAIAGCTGFLKEKVVERIAVPPASHSPLRLGNIALAVADAGLWAEMTKLVDHIGNGTPPGEPDSLKRWAWALALSGRHAASVDALALVSDSVECSKAIARIAGIIAGCGDDSLIERLNIKIRELLPGYEPRTEARLIHAMWTVGQREAALTDAESAIAKSGRFSPMIDPRAEKRNEPSGVRSDGERTRHRAMVTSRAPVVDQINCGEAVSAARKGDIASARKIVAKIEVPLFKAEALSAIASHDPDAGAGIDTWMEALIAARRAGRGEAELTLRSGVELLRKAGRQDETIALERRIADIDAAWQLELFIEEYSSLRTSMTPGWERTKILTDLILAPIHLARMRAWTKAEVRAAWDRGEDGARLFAVGLMRGDPLLIIPDLLAEAIRDSRSAFEQYNSLRAVADAQADIGVAETVLRAIGDEVARRPRADGSRAWLDEDSNRHHLAKQILERHKLAP